MADAHPILCSKCSKPGTADKAECASCGGRVVRKCGSCGFKNSAAKNYCDVCGEDFSAPKAAAAPKAPPPAPKAEPPAAKAPPPKAEPPRAAPKPAEPPRPSPKPAEPPRPAPKPAEPPKPAPKVEIKASDMPGGAPPPPPKKERVQMRLEDDAAAEPEKPAAPKAEPPKPEPRKPEPKAEGPLDLKPRPETERKPSKDEEMAKFLPKTVISRIPKPDAPRVVRDDEPVPDMTPAEKPKLPADEPPRRTPEKAGDLPPVQPPPKKERVAMRLEGDEPAPEKAPEKPAPKPADKSSDKPAEKARDKAPEKGKPGELDPRLAKGYEKKEKPAPAPSPAPKRVEGPSQTFIQRRPKAVLSTVVALVLLITGFVVFAIKSKQRKNPGDTLLKAAGDYLFALKQKEYDKAYQMLSADSRRSATAEAFRKMQDESSWLFDDISAEIVAPGWALVRYKLLVSGQPIEQDWLVMKQEEGQWRRAYWWTLMEGVESAFAAGDQALAARLAREAQAIDPLDPMPVAYYCEAAWLSGDMKAAQESCEKALKMYETLPSRLGGDGFFRARHIVADIERNVLKRPADAARDYGILLAYPKIEPDQACDLHFARAETELELAQNDAALEDFKQAQPLCRSEADRQFAARGTAVLSGSAGAEAVALVQAYRLPGDESALTEWRAKQRAELSKRLKTRVQDMPQDQWVPAHKGGSLYSVTLKSGSSDVLTAEADLFSRKVKVDMHVQ